MKRLLERLTRVPSPQRCLDGWVGGLCRQPGPVAGHDLGTRGGQDPRAGDNAKEKECVPRRLPGRTAHENVLPSWLDTWERERERKMRNVLHPEPGWQSHTAAPELLRGSVLRESRCASPGPDSLHSSIPSSIPSSIHSITQSLNIVVRCLWLMDPLVQPLENDHPLTIRTHCASFTRTGNTLGSNFILERFFFFFTSSAS